MNSQLYNNTSNTLAESVSDLQISFDVTIENIPEIDPGDYIPIYVIRASDGAFEIMHVTSSSGSTLTVERASEPPGDNPLTFNAGDRVEIRPTKQSLLDMAIDIGEKSVNTSTGEQTLAEALERRGPVFDNVADMKAETGLTVGVKVRTLGYYEPGDGGGNDYEIVAAGTGTDDGGSFIDLAGSGLQAKGLFPKGVFVEQFGAVGDGATDDTPAIYKALEFCRSSGRKLSDLAPRTYGINGATGPFETLDTGYGGGILLEENDRLVGAGIGKTILKNISDDWRMVVSSRGGDNIEIAGLTIDGDWPNRLPVTVDVDVKRGEGIIFWNPTDIVERLLIQNVHVKNTGHYGIGLQNVQIDGAILNTHYQNIGGDCIDIKANEPPNGPDTDKRLVIDGVFSYDGCGHNDSFHENQAVVDIGGKAHVSNVHVKNLDSYGTQIGNAGVRFRGRVDAQGRTGSKGSTASHIYINSAKLASEGSLFSKRIVGIAVNDESISLSSAYVDGGYWGIRFFASGDSAPLNCSASDIHVKNCTGTDGNSVGIGADASSRRLIIDGEAEGCDVGANINGVNHIIRLQLSGNDVSLEASDTVLDKSDVQTFISNSTTAASNNPRIVEGSNNFVSERINLTGAILPQLDIVSNADKGDWTSTEIFHGALRFISDDASGAGAGVRAAIRARMTGDNGAGTILEISATDSDGPLDNPVLRIFGSRIGCLYPIALKGYSVAGLPSAAAYTGSMVYLSDGASNRPIAISDGSDWRYADGTLV